MLSLCVCACVRGGKREGVDTFIQLFKHTHNTTTGPRRAGSSRSSPPALQMRHRPPTPPPPCRPSRTRHSRAHGKVTDFIYFDHQPCSFNNPETKLFPSPFPHHHPPPSPGSPPRPPPRGGGRAASPGGLRSGAGARAVLSPQRAHGRRRVASEQGEEPGASGTDA